MENEILALLASVGVVDARCVKPYYPRVRDRDDISALRCEKSGVIFLSRSDHVSLSTYADKPGDVMVQVGSDAIPFSDFPELGDTQRRAEKFGDLIRGKRWLDVGTGRGLILSLLKPVAKSAIGVEPTAALRAGAQASGLTVFSSVDEVTGVFDCITLFSVFEHLVDPIGMLKALDARLAPGGKIILEVPHARDFLLMELDCIAFRAFTLWSEHLVLHTRESLLRLAQLAGFENCVVRGYQRYPVSNHLYWLRHGRPGGHEHWNFINSEALHKEYGAALQAVDRTDTLVAILAKSATLQTKPAAGARPQG